MAIGACSVHEAREEILKDHVRNRKHKKIFYFDGWNGFGASVVLRSIAQILPSAEGPPELCFDKVIYIDCSTWKSKRTMQRKIAEELKLGHKTMSIFDKQSDEDDFNGVDHSSRDVIPSVAAEIDQALRDRNFLMIFLNGSNDEVDISRFGIPEYRDYVLIWAFKKSIFSMNSASTKIAHKLKYTHVALKGEHYWVDTINALECSLFRELLRGEAADRVAQYPSMKDVDLEVVVDCWLYELFLQSDFHRATGFDWTAHASNYWICEGIIEMNLKKEISNVLDGEVIWECDTSLLENSRSLNYPPYCLVLDNEEVSKPHHNFTKYSTIHPYHLEIEEHEVSKRKPYRWISVTSMKQEANGDVEIILARASSLFLAFQRSDNPPGIPNGMFQHCRNLGVLVLYYCAFSFVSPVFLQCLRTLRFLGLDHCTNNNTSDGEAPMSWAHLRSMKVLDLRYTMWDETLSKEKMDLMSNLTELNIEGFRGWQYTNQLQQRLPQLERLRVIKPMYPLDTSSADIKNSFVDNTKLEILDLSGNTDMKNLPTSLSNASNLQVLTLDGCGELENIIPNTVPPSLRLFSFDGYGSVSRWTSTGELPPESYRPMHPPTDNKRHLKICKISLRGCMRLQNLFLRGLHNLEELDLSGSAIKLLDFGTMVMDVPRLKRLFLLGCEHLRAVRWGSDDSRRQLKLELELICIDTLPWKTLGRTWSALAQYKPDRLGVYATLADARLARSLWLLIDDYRGNVNFSIHITSMNVYCGMEATGKEMTGANDQRHIIPAGQHKDVIITDEIYGARMQQQAFPQHLFPQLNRHVEIDGGCRSMESELEEEYGSANLASLLPEYTESLHVHDTSTSVSLPGGDWRPLMWCRVERCRNMEAVFGPAADFVFLETIWASDLLMARCILSKSFVHDYPPFHSLQQLKHLHLRSCPSLQFAIPVWVRSLPSLETLQIMRCGDLQHAFVQDGRSPEDIATISLQFPKLTTILLYDLPNLRQICEFKMMAPALESIRVRGCLGLHRLPALEGREPGVKKPAIEIEKDVWDALQWDGLAAGHCPELYEAPMHSRYYRRSHLLRGTVLR